MGGPGSCCCGGLLSLSLAASADGNVSTQWNLRQDFEYGTPCLSWAIPHLGRHIYHGGKCKFWGYDCSTYWPVHYLYLSTLSIPTTPPFPKNHTVELWPENNQGDSPCLSLDIKRQRCDEVTEQQKWVKNWEVLTLGPFVLTISQTVKAKNVLKRNSTCYLQVFHKCKEEQSSADLKKVRQVWWEGWSLGGLTDRLCMQKPQVQSPVSSGLPTQYAMNSLWTLHFCSPALDMSDMNWKAEI